MNPYGETNSGAPRTTCLRQCAKDLDIPGLIVTVICLIGFLLTALIGPTPMFVPENDSLSMFPKPDESHPYVYVITGIILVQAALITISWFLGGRYPDVVRKCKLCSAIWLSITCFAAAGIVTNVFKSYVGRPRPDLYAACGEGASWETCDPDVREDEFKSWPSGHSSSAMSGATIACFFFQDMMKIRHLWVSCVSCVFMGIGIYIGATRIIDYRHHADDVLAGLWIGWVITVVIWRGSSKGIFHDNTKEDEAHGDFSGESVV